VTFTKSSTYFGTPYIQKRDLTLSITVPRDVPTSYFNAAGFLFDFHPWYQLPKSLLTSVCHGA